MKVIFKEPHTGPRDLVFSIEGEKAEVRDGDVFLDGRLVGWYNIPDAGWFIAGLTPGRPKGIDYWQQMLIE